MDLQRSLHIVKDVMSKLGYEKLTEIQKLAIPKMLANEKDLIISAPTGSGKTEAAVIPLLAKIVDEAKPISVMYVTPLRALNRDILLRLHNIASIFRLSVNVWHGDTPQSTRKKILMEPPEILVTTPESLQIVLVKKELDKFIKNLKAVIVDEVQDIATSERGVELAVALSRLDRRVGRHVRRIAISSPIEHIDMVARYLLSRDYEAVSSRPGSKIYEITVKLAGNEYRDGVFSVEDVVKVIKDFAESDEYRQILIFTNTRVAAEELGFSLSRYYKESEDIIGVHHGSLSRTVREDIEREFKYGSIRMVISTSSLELGIDIGSVDVVLQYLSPRQAVKLIQRVGRAGHREGLKSRGMVIVPPILTEIFESIVIARRARNRLLETPILHYNPLDVLAHQIVGIAVEYERIGYSDLWNIITSAEPFNTLPFNKFEEVVEFLSSIGMIRCRDGVCEATKRGFIYYLTTNMIPDSVHFYAKSVVDDRTIGMLDEDFVFTCSVGDAIVLNGRAWNISSIDLTKRVVLLAPPEPSSAVVLPKWVGENIPVYRNVSRETCAFIRRYCTCSDDRCLEELYKFYNVDNGLREFLEKNRDKICRVFPSDSILTIEVHNLDKDGQTLIAFYHCLGSRASEAFSLLIATLMKQIYGYSIAYKSHQLGTVVLVNSIVKPQDLAILVRRLIALGKNESALRELIVREIRNTQLFKLKLIEVAKKFGVIRKGADSSEIKRLLEGISQIGVIVDEALREILTDRVDVDEAVDYIKNIAQRGGRIRIVKTANPSPYLVELSSLGALRDLIKSSVLPKDILVELAKRRLLSREVKLMCSLCYKTWVLNIGNAVSNCNDVFKCGITCPNCGSKAITTLDEDEDSSRLVKIFEKAKKGQKLKIEEEKILEKHRNTINMIMEYGLAFIIAIQGRGVGVETAKKILARSRDLNELVINIVEQEKLYLRTSPYWS